MLNDSLLVLDPVGFGSVFLSRVNIILLVCGEPSAAIVTSLIKLLKQQSLITINII